MFDFHYKPDILRNSRASGGLDQSPSARLTSHAQKQPPIAFLFHSSQPHGAPNGNVSFGRTSAHPQGPSCFSTHPPRSAEQNAPPPRPTKLVASLPPQSTATHPASQDRAGAGARYPERWRAPGPARCLLVRSGPRGHRVAASACA